MPIIVNEGQATEDGLPLPTPRYGEPDAALAAILDRQPSSFDDDVGSLRKALYVYNMNRCKKLRPGTLERLKQNVIDAAREVADWDLS